VINKNNIPKRFTTSDRQIKKMQLAFEFAEGIDKGLKSEALTNGLSPTAQLRKILGLPVDMPVKPRLSVTLSEDDRLLLAQRYNIDPDDRAFLRLNISREVESRYPETSDPEVFDPLRRE